MQSILEQQKISKEIRERIIDLLHLDDEKFHHTLYEVGMLYLHHYFCDDEFYIGFVSRRKEFWGWWKNQWFLRDKVFIESIKIEELSLPVRHSLYAGLHNPEVLAKDIFPARVVVSNFPITQNAMLC